MNDRSIISNQKLIGNACHRSILLILFRKNPKWCRFAGDILVSIFWHAKSTVFIVYCQNYMPIRDEDIANLQRKLRKAVSQKSKQTDEKRSVLPS